MAQCKEDRYIKGESKDTMGDVRERALALGACLLHYTAEVIRDLQVVYDLQVIHLYR